MVMPVGTAVGQRIDTAGFTVSDQIKLLGLIIKNVNSDFEESFIKIEQKIENLADFWERFRLSLPGRIAVMKTLLIPQINYLGSFLQPNMLILTRMQRKIDNFVLKNLNVSAERRYLPPELGGLGIFHLETFLSAQKCSWIHRASKLAIDNWRFDLKRFSPTDEILDVCPCDIRNESNPVLSTLVKAHTGLLAEFTKKELNFTVAPIVDNPAFSRGPRYTILIDYSFLGRTFYSAHKTELRKLTFEQCYQDGRYLSIEEYAMLGINISIATWMRLNLTLSYNYRRYSIPNTELATPKTYSDFMTSIQKGSCKFRRVLMHSRVTEYNLRTSTVVRTFFRNIDLDTVDEVALRQIHSSWNISFLPNDLWEFIFLERTNFLKIGVRAVNYMQTASEYCSLCRIINPDTVSRETMLHLFSNCPITTALLRGLMRTLGLKFILVTTDFSSKYWLGMLMDKFEISLFLTFAIFWHIIWKFKLRKIIPTQPTFVGVFISYFKMIKEVRPALFTSLSNHFSEHLLLQAMG
jgi:hypothetical protein